MCSHDTGSMCTGRHVDQNPGTASGLHDPASHGFLHVIRSAAGVLYCLGNLLHCTACRLCDFGPRVLFIVQTLFAGNVSAAKWQLDQHVWEQIAKCSVQKCSAFYGLPRHICIAKLSSLDKLCISDGLCRGLACLFRQGLAVCELGYCPSVVRMEHRGLSWH